MPEDRNNEEAVDILLKQLLRFKRNEFQEARPFLFEVQKTLEEVPPGIEFCEYKTSSHVWKCGVGFSGFIRWRTGTSTEVKKTIIEVLQPLMFASLWLEREDGDPYAAFLAHFDAEIAKLK